MKRGSWRWGLGVMVGLLLFFVATWMPIMSSQHHELLPQFFRQVKKHEIVNVWYNEGMSDFYVQLHGSPQIVVLPNPESNSFRSWMLEQGLSVQSLFSLPVWLQQNMTMIVYGVFMLGFSLLLRRQLMTGKSQRKKAPKANVHFEDIGGLFGIKEDLIEWAHWLRHRKDIEERGGQVPRGMLLYGPPGTGKTMMAKALAKEAGVSFLSASGSEFVEMYVGVGASRIRDLFARAKAMAPCLIFIDEIDGLASHRGTSHREHDQTLNQFLVELDGLDQDRSQAGIYVLAATNRLDQLDKALLRPGRFDRLVPVQLPEIGEREAILRKHARDKKIDPTVDFAYWAKKTIGMNGASLANLLNEAVLLSVRHQHAVVQQQDLEEAFERSITGGKAEAFVSSLDQTIVTIHEAGHAVMGILCGRHLARVSCLPSRNGMGGYTMFDPQTKKLPTCQERQEDLLIFLAGRAAERLFFRDEGISMGASQDFEAARDLLREAKKARLWPLEGNTIEGTLDVWEKKAEQRLLPHRDVILALSQQLQEHEFLEEQALLAFFDRHSLVSVVR